MASAGPEIGSRISLISNSGIRYEGSLYAVDPVDCTIALASVRSFGTENRNVEDQIPGTNHIFEYILFRGSDIKDIQMIETRNLPNDPAIVQTATMPPMPTPPPPQQQQQPRPVLAATVPFVRQIVYPQQFTPMAMARQSNPMIFNRSGPVSQPVLSAAVPPVIEPKRDTEPESLPKQAPKSALKKPRKPAPGASDTENEQPLRARKEVEVLAEDKKEEEEERQPLPNKRPVRQTKVPKQAAAQVSFEPGPRRDYQQSRPFRRDYSGPSSSLENAGDFTPRQQYQRQGWRDPNNTNRYGNNNVGYANVGYRQYQRGGNFRYQNGDQRRINFGGGGGGVMSNGNNRVAAASAAADPGKPNRSQNRTPKIQFKDDYDFEQANIEFEELRAKLDGVSLRSPTAAETARTNDATDASADKSNRNESKQAVAASAAAASTNGAGAATDSDSNAVYYNKFKSFFDNISCGESESNPKPDWNKERKLNTETFGFGSANGNRRRPNRDNNNRNRVFTNRSGGLGPGPGFIDPNYHGNRPAYYYSNGGGNQQPRQRHIGNNRQQPQQQAPSVVQAAD